MRKAKRPPMELEEKVDDRFAWACKTCWQGLVQPVIKGIFYHSDEWQQSMYKCKKLIPIKYEKLNKEKSNHCYHQYRFHPDLGSAVQCIKCHKPKRIEIFDIRNQRGNYFCIQCNKVFKILSEHYIKVHKRKGFEYDKLPVIKSDN